MATGVDDEGDDAYFAPPPLDLKLAKSIPDGQRTDGQGHWLAWVDGGKSGNISGVRCRLRGCFSKCREFSFMFSKTIRYVGIFIVGFIKNETTLEQPLDLSTWLHLNILKRALANY